MFGLSLSTNSEKIDAFLYYFTSIILCIINILQFQSVNSEKKDVINGLFIYLSGRKSIFSLYTI